MVTRTINPPMHIATNSHSVRVPNIPCAGLVVAIDVPVVSRCVVGIDVVLIVEIFVVTTGVEFVTGVAFVVTTGVEFVVDIVDMLVVNTVVVGGVVGVVGAAEPLTKT